MLLSSLRFLTPPRWGTNPSQVNPQCKPVPNISLMDGGNADKVPCLRTQPTTFNDHKRVRTIDFNYCPMTTEQCVTLSLYIKIYDKKLKKSGFRAFTGTKSTDKF